MDRQGGMKETAKTPRLLLFVPFLLNYYVDMPIYEYECLPNKHRFEVIQKFNDPPVTHCTVCGEPVQKVLSSPAFQFKGSGWYITDYARKGKSDGESSSRTESPKKDSTSTETKPAEKKES